MYAQVATGDIVGTVVDASGSVLPGAEVRLENTGTHQTRTLTTTSDGAYSISLLPPGSYILNVTAPGFKSFRSTNFVLAAADRLRIDPKLAVGEVTDTVEVVERASALQTDSTNVGSTLSSRSIADLPLNGRNYINLVQVQPGVNAGSPNSLNSGTRLSDRRQSSSVSANGQSEVVNNQLLDGLDNNDRYIGVVELRPSVEAIEQVRVDINLYTAEVGRTAGAAINVITKSGTNNLHGSLYEFFRNDITDTRNYFAPPNLLARKPELRQNQFGGSVGGPLIRNRSFFFADYEQLRRIDATQSVYISTVPTAFEEQNPGNITDICTGNSATTPIAGCATPIIAAIDPTSLSYFKLYPTPNRPGTVSATGTPVNNYISNPSSTQVTQLGDVRIDQHVGSQDVLYGRYSYNRSNTFTPPYYPAVNGVYAAGVISVPAPSNNEIVVHNAQLDFTHVISPSLLLEAKTGYTYYISTSTPLNYGTNLNNTAQFRIPNASDCSLCSGLATIGITSFGYLGDQSAAPAIFDESTYQYVGSLIYTKGQHTVKLGGGVIRRDVSPLQAIFKAYISFSGATPQAALTNFFKGAPYVSLRQVPLIKPYLATWEPSAYLQDDWHASKSLTLNYGIRYDVFSAPNEKYGNNTNFGLQTLQEVQSQTAGVNTSYVNVAPRFGFAVTPAKGFVVRGGFGLSYYASDIVSAFELSNAPLVYVSGVVPSATPLSIAGVSPAVAQSTAQAALAGTLNSKPPNFRDAYVEQFNLLMQKEFGGTVFTIGYVGELGRRLETSLPNVDNPPPTGPVPAGTPPPTQIYAATLPKVTAITLLSDQGSESYHSFQTSIERRLYRGLTANLNFTHAHILDDVNTGNGMTDPSYGLLPASFNTYDYGNSLLDVANRFAGTFTYQLPFGASGSTMHKALFGGFQLNGLGFWQSGQPVPVTATYTQNGRAQINLTGVTTDRPDRVGPYQTASTGGVNNFFNVAAFARQALGTAGNAGRDQLRGPSFRRGDLSVFKDFPIHEALRGQLRTECFNITNTPNFALPNANITAYASTADANGRFLATSAGGFGTITATSPGSAGRQFQFALRLLF